MSSRNDLTPTPSGSTQHGGRHHERPGATPATAFVPVSPDLPSGRRRAPESPTPESNAPGALARFARTLRGTS